MKALGIAIKKNEICFAILDGSLKSDAVITLVEKHSFRAGQPLSDLMMCFYNLFTEVIDKNCPDKIACKVHLDSKKDQIPYMHYPIGVLAYICKLKNIALQERTGAWITGGKKKKMIECMDKFKEADLKTEKLAAVLIAWFEYGD
ncbi:MAG: hypothetical protein RSA96_04305 [Erysipelotrichaceae bacterium]